MNDRNFLSNISRGVLGAALILMAICSGCAVFGYTLHDDGVDSRVIDADTGKPIQGAVVVAYWEMHRGSFAGDSLPCGAANVEEAVTDKNGKFHIPGWGPIHSSCEMRSFDPFLYVFKSGYGYARVGNYPLNPPFITSTHSEWNDKPIKLKKFPDLDLTKTGIHSYAADFGALNVDELENFVVDFPTECNWKKIPNMLLALMAQAKLFRAAGNPVGSIASDLTQDDQDRFMQKIAPQCGSPKTFVEGLEQGTEK